MSFAGGESKEHSNGSSTSQSGGGGWAASDFSALEQFSIFNKKGHVLWQQHGAKNALVNHLIDSVLVQERQGEHKEDVDDFVIKWLVQVDLIFVCVYRRSFLLSYIDDLLQCARDKFNEMYDCVFLASRVRVFRFLYVQVTTSVRGPIAHAPPAAVGLTRACLLPAYLPARTEFTRCLRVCARECLWKLIVLLLVVVRAGHACRRLR
jgi:hypothetical protein